jgi:hypothetical protein
MFRRLAWAIAIAVVATACFEPPTTERQQADSALAAARAADAATYAPDTLAAAEKALSQYDAAVAQRDYKQALRLALEARDGAYDAARRAGDEKAAAQSRTDALLREVETLIRNVETRASEPGTPRAHATRLRASARTAGQTLQEARTQIGAEQYQQALAALTAAAASLRAELEAPAPTRRR